MPSLLLGKRMQMDTAPPYTSSGQGIIEHLSVDATDDDDIRLNIRHAVCRKRAETEPRELLFASCAYPFPASCSEPMSGVP
jgi:hypothetical protein